jgi:hypothetical protein
VIIAFVVFSGAVNNMLSGASRAVQPAQPRWVTFKELVLDGKALADENAPVIVDGVYSALNEDVAMLYPPTRAAMSFSDDSVRLLTDENSPRDVREFFYACRQRGLDGCQVHLTGRMTTCYLKINSNATFPCLQVETAASR